MVAIDQASGSVSGRPSAGTGSAGTDQAVDRPGRRCRRRCIGRGRWTRAGGGGGDDDADQANQADGVARVAPITPEALRVRAMVRRDIAGSEHGLMGDRVGRLRRKHTATGERVRRAPTRSSKAS